MFKHIKHAAEFALEFTLDMVYPEMCIFCGEPLGIEGKRFLTCGKCVGGLPVANHYEGGNYCLFTYEGQVAELVRGFKYANMRRHAYRAGLLMAEYGDCAAVSAADALVPVPLHRKRMNKRGYNQAAEICRGLADVYGKPILSGLSRVRETKALYGLNEEERKKTVDGVFEYAGTPNGMDIRGKGLVIVDDILTTGATVNECIKVLRASGAGDVRCVMFARAVPENFN